jgi:hypothetical protein
LSIESYFRWFQAQIEACPAISHTVITFEKRDPGRGFVRGELFFIDGSVLHVREFVSVAHDTDRLVYAYQYMTPERELVFRYDNADHYRHLNLPNSPHHKHEGNEAHVVASDGPTLDRVLAEVETLVKPN